SRAASEREARLSRAALRKQRGTSRQGCPPLTFVSRISVFSCAELVLFGSRDQTGAPSEVIHRGPAPRSISRRGSRARAAPRLLKGKPQKELKQSFETRTIKRHASLVGFR